MAGGRPLKFKTPEELQKKIDVYLADCGWVTRQGLTKDGEEYEKKYFRPATITGLAVALDTSRKVLVEYGEKEEFSNTIRRAKQRCEQDLEEGTLAGQLNPAMAIFSLKNNNKWTDKTEVESTHKFDKEVKINITLDGDKFQSESKAE